MKKLIMILLFMVAVALGVAVMGFTINHFNLDTKRCECGVVLTPVSNLL